MARLFARDLTILVSVTLLLSSLYLTGSARASDDENSVASLSQVLDKLEAIQADIDALRKAFTGYLADVDDQEDRSDAVRQAQEEIDQLAEDAKTVYEESSALFSLAIKVIRDHEDRESEALAALNGTTVRHVRALQLAFEKLEPRIIQLLDADDIDPLTRDEAETSLRAIGRNISQLEYEGGFEIIPPQSSATSTPRPLATPRTPDAPKTGTGPR
jgi:hypothetical protein